MLKIKADTFVLESNIHFPTDFNLLWDCARKCIGLAENLSVLLNLQGWRKSKSWRREIKKIFRVTSKTNSSGGKFKEERLQDVTRSYIELCIKLSKKIDFLLKNEELLISLKSIEKGVELLMYKDFLDKYIDLVQRRILEKEKIPSSEKLYSIFETHTEWLSKGKAGKLVEFGHKLLIATDQYHFIIHHKVIESDADVNLTVDLVIDIKDKYPDRINTLSLDKGFYSKLNKDLIKDEIPLLIVPKKGNKTKDEIVEESNTKFKILRNKHSAVESNINQLEHNGLSKCRDKGIEKFKRYASLGVLAYNMFRLGKYIKNSNEIEFKNVA